ncbi:DUF6519 domain-containing protein [Lyngbya confervoides]|uniref:Right-handed parallel beta-helix repeat-containing protein n=1 Tax=Lyngbya confervoides BDU141951 TaxID=1574623 RepID=A0ABD4T0D9_9CYAN|nr:DUF6519 domain-containing protein [Lyngbya confervoides]MCM1982221.1 right-handed parallel beta-helix repeat-containing protein [Lyngbya confervoides BDU141951]
MATEDISRFLFQPEKRYASVRMQQGRVLMDSDWNEAERLDQELDRQTLMDLVCAKGTSNTGFQIADPAAATVSLPPDGDLSNDVQTYDFAIAPGSFYLGGLRFTAPGQPFLDQLDWLQQDARGDGLPSSPETLASNAVRQDLVYLRGWEQCVTAVEDRELREQALGGPDTSVRMRRMQRVEVLPDVSDTCAAAMTQLQQQLTAGLHTFDDRTCELQSAARLTVSPDPNGVTEDPCRPAVSSGYLGADNQTIRVQLTAPDRFLWSYDNAAPLYRVQVDANDLTQVRFLTLPRDQEAQPLAGQAVEIIPWGALLPNQEKIAELQGQFFTIASSYDPTTQTLTLAQGIDPAWLVWLADHPEYHSDRDPSQEQQYFYLRLWTGGSGEATSPDFGFTPTVPVSLPGTGLSVTFSSLGLTGDFWIMAARPNTPALVVPWDLLVSAPPMGPRVYVAPLALIRWQTDENGELREPEVRDCRDRFQPLCQIRGCCTVTVGDGNQSQGLFNALEEAIAFLPPEGGKVCLLPGVHRANVVLENRQNLRISGCGPQTIVQPRPDQVDQPIFRLDGAQDIHLDQMTLVAQSGTAIQVLDTEAAIQPSRGIHILWNDIVARVHAIEIRVDNTQLGNSEIRIAHNHLGILDTDQGRAIIFSLADDVVIERNRLVVVPAPDPSDPNDPRRPQDFPDDPFDNCIRPQFFSTANFAIQAWTVQTFNYIAILTYLPPRTYQAQGGIQIGGSSDQVRIVGNEIFGGSGHGVTLGHWPTVVTDTGRLETGTFFVSQFPEQAFARIQEAFVSTLYAIVIAENQIQFMGLSGIGVGAFLIGDRIGLRVRVEDLTVYRNQITHCAQQIPAEIPEALLPDMAFGGIALTDCELAIIQENRIEDNGLSHRDPVCGIFILYGEKIEITNNRILNNGPRTSASNANLRSGVRGGIVIGISFQPLAHEIDQGEELLSPDGIPAVKIHGNIVTQPLGQALFIVAFGPVSIVGNQFTSQDVDVQVNPISLLAGTVYILNLGLSQDLATSLLLNSFRTAATHNAAGFEQAPQLTSDPAALRRIFYLPSGSILFANNQTTLDLRAEEIDLTLSSQLLASLDDIAYNSNQSECTTILDFLLTNTMMLGVTIRSNDNRFQEGATITVFSLISLGFVNMATGNQATHCLFVYSPAFRVEALNTILYSGLCERGNVILARLLGLPPVQSQSRA